MWSFRFVLAFALVVCSIAVAAVFNRRSTRVTDPRGLPGRGLPLLEVAFLAGGPARVVDTALVRMEREGRVVVSRAHRVTVTADRTTDPVERVLITAVGGRAGRDLSVLRASVPGSPEVQRIGDGLAARGLLRHPGALKAAWRARRLVVLALVVTLVLGAVSTAQWLDSPGRDSTVPPFFPFGVLTLFTLVSLVATRPAKRRITPAGLRQLQLVRGSTPWQPREVERAHAELVGAFALDGAAALKGSDQQALREALGGGTAPAGRLVKSGRSGRNSDSSSSDFAAGAGAGVWCGSSSSSSCGSSGGHSGGSSHHSCGGSSSHSCGGSSHSCGSSSSCGSSCGGGGCGGS